MMLRRGSRFWRYLSRRSKTCSGYGGDFWCLPFPMCLMEALEILHQGKLGS